MRTILGHPPLLVGTHTGCLVAIHTTEVSDGDKRASLLEPAVSLVAQAPRFNRGCDETHLASPLAGPEA
jgi:hypothetical protein